MDSLFGITFSRLFRLLADNKFNISVRQIPKVFLLLLVSVRNSVVAKKSKKLFQKKSNKIVKAPIFIIGHWRSGTTFLHNLLIQDKQFIYPKIIEVIHPFTFAYLEEHYLEKIKAHNVKNRPMDNVKNDPLSAGEEEFALAALTLKSPIVGWVFPKRYDYYERYLCFEDVEVSEKEEWKKEYINYLEKVNFDDGKTLILKSPTNTARIKIILEMFPDAKFVCIHRNPYDVYSSTKKLHNTAIKTTNLQTSFKYDVHKRIISTYKKLYTAYFSQRELIQEKNFVKISFNELENDPVKTIAKIYTTLQISGYEKMKPDLLKYLEKIGEYKKNKHPELAKEIKEDIYNQWKEYFTSWGYEK